MKKFKLTGYRISALSDLIPSLRGRLESYELCINNSVFTDEHYLIKQYKEDCKKLRVAIAVLYTYFHRDFNNSQQIWEGEFSIPREDFIVGTRHAVSLSNKWLNNKDCIVSDYGKSLYKSYLKTLDSIVKYRLEWDKQLKESDIYG